MRDRKWLSSMLEADWNRNTSSVRQGSMVWADIEPESVRCNINNTKVQWANKEAQSASGKVLMVCAANSELQRGK